MRPWFATLSWAISLTTAVPVAAQDDPFGTGNDLLRTCSSSDSTARTPCYAYLRGVLNGHWASMANYRAFRGVVTPTAPEMGEIICTPQGFTWEQGKDVVVSYLRDNPTTRHFPAASLVLGALAISFPCVSSVQPEEPSG